MENTTTLHSEKLHPDEGWKSDYTGNFIFGIPKHFKTAEKLRQL